MGRKIFHLFGRGQEFKLLIPGTQGRRNNDHQLLYREIRGRTVKITERQHNKGNSIMTNLFSKSQLNYGFDCD